ncbi:adenine specific DNA methylase [Bifidobacterium catenulatum subsp. kashiwanohense JCM 15439 = DSM 21854]|nr:adenine specific DNA methylase [Bifidobacterium catenulatum subsp. kashiwanohense JCM 15439 = DSM 21854]
MDGSAIVVNGITNKGEHVPGIDSGFSYYELGSVMFDADGGLNADVSEAEIRRYIWYSETKAPYVDMTAEHPYLLGVLGETVYYLAYEPTERPRWDRDC